MSTDARRQHLTDQELSDLLCGEQPDAAVALHLAACDHCRQELDTVGGSLGSFRELGTVWARAKAPAMIAVPSRWARGLVSMPSWGTGLAVAATAGVLAFALGLTPRQAPSPNSTPDSASVTAAPSRKDLADDNSLMVSIDQELSYRSPVTVAAASPSGVHRALHNTAEALLE